MSRVRQGQVRRVSHLSRWARLLVMMIRPPVAAVVLLFAALGIVRAEPQADLHPLLTTVLVMLAGWFVNAAVLNDLADEPIDRVNLPTARGRPLVSGHATRRQLLALGLVGAVTALTVAWAQNGRVVAVVAGGLVLNAAYSLRPVRISARGAVASAILPAGYVAVPYLIGAFTVKPDLAWRDLALLPGLYVGFVGRILLKDFRDVAGDALFGKWTFLLRHGRRATCQVSATCWIVGATAAVAVLPGTVGIRAVTAAGCAAYVACAVHGLTRLAHGKDPIADQVVIGAIAQAGRGVCLTVLAHLLMVDQGWAAGSQAAVVALLAVVFVASYLATLAQREPVWALRPC